MTMWLVNEGKKRKGRRVARAKRKRRMSAKARAAALRNLKKARAAQNPKRKRKAVTRTRRRARRITAKRRRPQGESMAKRKRHRARANPRRRRVRHRRNPGGFRVGGIVQAAQQGFKDATAIVAGKAAARAIPALVGLNAAGPTGLAIQGAAAIAAGMAAGKFFGANAGRLVLAGGLAAIVESFVKSLNIPVISPALGEYTDPLGEYALAGGGDQPELIGGGYGDEY